jgi:hypothetical protein
MHAFEREVLRAIMLRPSARLSQRVDEFVERELGGAAYDASTCARRSATGSSGSRGRPSRRASCRAGSRRAR